jgi:PAS domain S-box-containing protein
MEKSFGNYSMFFTSITMRFFKTGIRNDFNEELNLRVETSNKFSVYVASFFMLYTFTFLLAGNFRLAFMAFFCGGFALGTILFNQQGWVMASRIFLSLFPLVNVFVFNAIFIPSGEQLAVAYYIMATALSVLPFILFTFQEKEYLLGTFAVNLFLLFTLSEASSLSSWKIQTDLTSLTSPTALFVVKASGMLVLAGLLYYMLFSGAQALIRIHSLTEGMKRRNKELEDSEQSFRKMVKEVEKAREKDQMRNHVTAALSDFNALLRERSDEQETFDRAIAFLIKTVKANQGALYLAEEENDQKFLQLKACYAYGRKKYLEQRINIGEGLVGQIYLEREKIMLTEVPEDYVRITSGLGEALPRCVIIIPMIYQEQVEGVLELAAFHVLDEYQIDLLEKAAASLASTVTDKYIHRKTEELLRISQEQAEMMSAQEEELRQNMEEMTVTQEQLQKQQAEMSNVMKAINTSGFVAEFTPTGDVLFINEAFCKLFEVREEEMLGANCREFDARATEDPEAYEQIWRDLAQGKTVVVDTKIPLGHKVIWMKETYTPIFNKDGDFLKVMLISSDITSNQAELDSRLKVIESCTIMSESDLYGTITFVNDKLCEVSKYSREELIGKPHNIFRHPDMPKEVFKKLWQTIKTGETFRGIIKNRAKDGSVYWVDAVISPVLDSTGKPVKYIGARYVIEDEEYAQMLFDRMMAEGIMN